MFLFSVGEGPPLVTQPAGAPSRKTRNVAADAAAGHFKSDQLARDALFLLPGERGAADEIAFVELHDPARSASNGVMVAWISWP